MILLTPTLGSRKYFLPESPSVRMIACFTRRFRRHPTMFSWDYVPSLLQFPTIDVSLWITTYICRSYIHPQLILLLQDTPKFSLLFREYFVPTALQFFATWIPLRIISRTYRVSAHPQMIHVFHKILRNTIRFSKNPEQPIAPELLACLRYG